MPSRPARAAALLITAALVPATALAGGTPALASADTAVPVVTAEPATAEPVAEPQAELLAEPVAEPVAVPVAEPVVEERVRDLFHDGYGVVVVEGRHPAAPQEIHYVVRVTWSGDGHPADPTTALTATVVGPAGELPPVALTSQDADGRFEGRVAFPGPGVWTVRFSAPHPQTTWETVEAVPFVAAPLPFA